MNKNAFRSIGAVLAGFITIFVLSTGTDAVLESMGVFSRGPLPLYGSESLIIAILIYRLIYSVVGCYVTAWLVPVHPVRHALALGILGFIFSTIGAIAGRNLGPAWYLWGLVVFALPCAWLGGKLYERARADTHNAGSVA